MCHTQIYTFTYENDIVLYVLLVCIGHRHVHYRKIFWATVGLLLYFLSKESELSAYTFTYSDRSKKEREGRGGGVGANGDGSGIATTNCLAISLCKYIRKGLWVWIIPRVQTRGERHTIEMCECRSQRLPPPPPPFPLHFHTYTIAHKHSLVRRSFSFSRIPASSVFIRFWLNVMHKDFQHLPYNEIYSYAQQIFWTAHAFYHTRLAQPNKIALPPSTKHMLCSYTQQMAKWWWKLVKMLLVRSMAFSCGKWTATNGLRLSLLYMYQSRQPCQMRQVNEWHNGSFGCDSKYTHRTFLWQNISENRLDENYASDEHTHRVYWTMIMCALWLSLLSHHRVVCRYWCCARRSNCAKDPFSQLCLSLCISYRWFD